MRNSTSRVPGTLLSREHESAPTPPARQSHPAQVTIRADAIRNGNFSGDKQTVNRRFDATAGQVGTSAKGVNKGPLSAIVNTGLFKRIDMTERVRLRLEMTSTNP